MRYRGRAHTQTLVVTNDGSVPAPWRFAPKLAHARICEEWLSVAPTYGLLMPGEQPVSIHQS